MPLQCHSNLFIVTNNNNNNNNLDNLLSLFMHRIIFEQYEASRGISATAEVLVTGRCIACIDTAILSVRPSVCRNWWSEWKRLNMLNFFLTLIIAALFCFSYNKPYSEIFCLIPCSSIVVCQLSSIRYAQWYSSSQNHFSFSFYKVWAQSFLYKFLYTVSEIFSVLVSIKFF